MDDLRYPVWQEPVRLASIESDPQQRREKIKSARMAVEQRYFDLQDDPDPQYERTALRDALSLLNVLERRIP
jgi:hypothetical protein